MLSVRLLCEMKLKRNLKEKEIMYRDYIVLYNVFISYTFDTE